MPTRLRIDIAGYHHIKSFECGRKLLITYNQDEIEGTEVVKFWEFFGVNG